MIFLYDSLLIFAPRPSSSPLKKIPILLVFDCPTLTLHTFQNDPLVTQPSIPFVQPVWVRTFPPQRRQNLCSGDSDPQPIFFRHPNSGAPCFRLPSQVGMSQARGNVLPFFCPLQVPSPLAMMDHPLVPGRSLRPFGSPLLVYLFVAYELYYSPY